MLDYRHAHHEIEPRSSDQQSPGNRNYKFSFPISLTSKTVEKLQGNLPSLVSQAQGTRAQRVFPRFSASPDFDNRVALLAAQRKTLRFMDGASLYLCK
jgi:hypothetical protein